MMFYRDSRAGTLRVSVMYIKEKQHFIVCIVYIWITFCENFRKVKILCFLYIYILWPRKYTPEAEY